MYYIYTHIFIHVCMYTSMYYSAGRDEDLRHLQGRDRSPSPSRTWVSPEFCGASSVCLHPAPCKHVQVKVCVFVLCFVSGIFVVWKWRPFLRVDVGICRQGFSHVIPRPGIACGHAEPCQAQQHGGEKTFPLHAPRGLLKFQGMRDLYFKFACSWVGQDYLNGYLLADEDRLPKIRLSKDWIHGSIARFQ